MKFIALYRSSNINSKHMSKQNVAIIFGGKSTEHEISKLSTKSILKHIDKEKHNLSLIKIAIDGTWYLLPELDIDATENAPAITLTNRGTEVHAINSQTGQSIQTLDLVFPVLHGAFGEDGTIQGYFRMLNLAFVGCDVLASAACMDKDITKRLLRDAGINIAPYLMATPQHKPSFDEAQNTLGVPMFLKPANLGSSVGVYKVSTEADYNKYLAEGLKLDHKVLIEKSIKGREIECAVLGNESPKASLPGEIVMTSDFYDFESKYVDSNASSTVIPAEITEGQVQGIRDTAVKAFQTLGCEGLARVDFFLTEDGELMINEINTLPGFTNISMYPKMWEATGITYAELLDILIELAADKHKRDQALNFFAKQVS